MFQLKILEKSEMRGVIDRDADEDAFPPLMPLYEQEA
jgi:hypothetical protein